MIDKALFLLTLFFTCVSPFIFMQLVAAYILITL